MEEAKAAAYYEELLAKGAGAARSKQGLGFSSSAPTHSSSPVFIPGHGRDRDRDRERRRSRSPRRRRSRSPRRSSSSRSPPRRRTSRSPPRRRSSRSPSRRGRERDRGDGRVGGESGFRGRMRELGLSGRRRGSGGDARLQPVNSLELTPGWDAMTPAERVKAKMKQQLQALPSGVANPDNDASNGNDRGWERYSFNAAAPLDEDQAGKETEAEARDAKDLHVTNVPFVLPKPTKAQTEADHDAAIFGTTDTHDETPQDDGKEVLASSSPVLLNEKILQSQKSLPWQERVRLARAERATPGVSRLAGNAADIT
eukprot:jgi/Chlat1/3368/Chrsp23S03715